MAGGLLNHPCLSNVQTPPLPPPQKFLQPAPLRRRFIAGLIRFATPFEIQARAYFIRRRLGVEERRLQEVMRGSEGRGWPVNIELAKWSKLQPPARVIFRKSPSAVDYLLSLSLPLFLSLFLPLSLFVCRFVSLFLSHHPFTSLALSPFHFSPWPWR